MLAEDDLAGTELMVASIITRSPREWVAHDLATLRPPGPIAKLVAETGLPLVVSLGGSGGFAGAAWRLARLLRRGRYDVITAYGLKASSLARILTRLLSPGTAFVCGVRGSHVTEVESLDSPKARIASGVERLLSPLVTLYDANSQAALELLGGLGIAADRLVYIPNGLDLARWSPRPPDAPPPEPPLIVCAARFAPVKRHRDLLEALGILRGQGLDFRVVLAGEGPDLAEMRELAGRLGLGSAVSFPGRIGADEVRELLADATVVCLPSSCEGMPGALMEAMASGVPVVATDVPGTRELVVGGRSGLLVPAYDPPALAAALADVIRDRALRERLVEEGRRRIEESFSLDAMLGAKERLYLGLGGRR